jgi:hypothetical protein
VKLKIREYNSEQALSSISPGVSHVQPSSRYSVPSEKFPGSAIAPDGRDGKPGEVECGESADGKCDFKQSAPASTAIMTLTTDSRDCVKILTGELDGMQAFMRGKLELGGDLNLGMKLMQMFKIR